MFNKNSSSYLVRPTNVSLADWNTYISIKKIMMDGYDDFKQEVRTRWADDTPAHTKFILHHQETYDIRKAEIPITRLRPIAWKSGIGEILWIYRDASNDLDLLHNKYNVNWWDQWDIGDRTIGSCYGAVVRQYDLFNKLIRGLKDRPFDRRHIMNLWQENELAKPHGLDPCCFMTIWSVTEESGSRYLHLKLEQRSSDYITANHINKMQYLALQMLVARELDMKVATFTHAVTNLHIYDRHFAQAEEMLRRFEQELLAQEAPLIHLQLNSVSIDKIMPNDFHLLGYQPLASIGKLEVAK